MNIARSISSRAFVVTALAAVLIVGALASQSPGVESSKDVRVVNTASEPVPVAPQGTTNVSITNTPVQISGSVSLANTPVPTTPGLPAQPYTDYVEFQTNEGLVDGIVIGPVPPSTKLAITSLTTAGGGVLRLYEAMEAAPRTCHNSPPPLFASEVVFTYFGDEAHLTFPTPLVISAHDPSTNWCLHADGAPGDGSETFRLFVNGFLVDD